MHTGYAHSKTVYQELRSVIGPWAKSHGFRRWSGTQAGWHKAMDAGQLLGFKFEGTGWSCCLVRSELDRLAQIQGTINRWRLPLPQYLEKDAQEDSLLGHHLRELYAPSPQYREGQLVPFSYYSIEDVRDLVTFIVAVLPDALALRHNLPTLIRQPFDAAA